MVLAKPIFWSMLVGMTAAAYGDEPQSSRGVACACLSTQVLVAAIADSYGLLVLAVASNLFSNILL